MSGFVRMPTLGAPLMRGGSSDGERFTQGNPVHEIRLQGFATKYVSHGSEQGMSAWQLTY